MLVAAPVSSDQPKHQATTGRWDPLLQTSLGRALGTLSSSPLRAVAWSGEQAQWAISHGSAESGGTALRELRPSHSKGPDIWCTSHTAVWLATKVEGPPDSGAQSRTRQCGSRQTAQARVMAGLASFSNNAEFTRVYHSSGPAMTYGG